MDNILNYILNDLGAHIFLPIVMLTVGLIVKMKFKDAFSSALTLGVAFIGMGTVIGFMFNSIGPASESLVRNTGIALNAIDTGWSPASTIAWAWPYAFFLFPIQILINIIMLAFNKTDTLNVDLWNVWGKVFTAALVSSLTGSIYIALVIAGIQVVLELKMCDLTQKSVQEVTHIPGVGCSHSMLLSMVILYPIDLLLRKIPIMNKKMDAEILRDKIGIFAENHVMGFVIGVLIGFSSGYNFSKSLTLGVQAGTALVLFPMVAKLFMQALSPISEAASEYMKNKFPDRNFNIGLDWPIMAGSSEIWVTAIVLVPITLVFAVILPKNTVLPFGGIINIGLAVSVMILSRGNLIRMFTLGVISIPLYLYSATYFAPIITKLASNINTITIPQNQLITWSSIETPVLRWIFVQTGQIVQGKFIGIIILVIWGILYLFFSKEMKQRNIELQKKFNGEDV